MNIVNLSKRQLIEIKLRAQSNWATMTSNLRADKPSDNICADVDMMQTVAFTEAVIMVLRRDDMLTTAAINLKG